MAEKVDDEIQSILENQELDTAKIAAQVMQEVNNPPEKKEERKPETPPPGPEKPEKKEISDPEAVRAAILNEMFGEQFKTVEDVKKANIPGVLQEVATLRQKTHDLETQLNAKPKHHYANDDIAKLDEFIRATGIKDVSVFNRLHGEEVANIADMDALILNHIIEHPRLATKDPQDIRTYFERKYSLDPSKIDPKLVESGDLTPAQLEENKRNYRVAQMELEVDAEKAKTKLLDLKSKIKMPEIQKEDGSAPKPKWTPDVEKTQKESWATVGNAVLDKFEKLPLQMKNSKGEMVVIANFALPENAKTDLLGKAIKFITDNQMEVNEQNVKAITKAIYSNIKETYFEDILHTVFERARSMSEKEILEFYHNPSKKTPDSPERKEGPLSDEEIQKKAFDLEYNRG